jgi:hypothetical protein
MSSMREVSMPMCVYIYIYICSIIIYVYILSLVIRYEPNIQLAHFFRISPGVTPGVPNTVVSAESVNTFKSCLDKLWAHQDFKFVWNADITGMKSRSMNSYSYFEQCIHFLDTDVEA